MTAKPYDETDVKLVARALWAECRADGPPTQTCYEDARAALDALARAGRLRPPTTDEQVRAGADALVRLRTTAPGLSELNDEEQSYWLRDAAAVLDAVGGPTGTCPCTCHQPDRCPCKPGAPQHKHGAGGYCTAAEKAAETEHVIAFDPDGTWRMEHPLGCRAADLDFDCKVRLLAERQITSDLTPLVAGGRYTCSAGDLGDLFQLGERLHDDQCTTPRCAACGCWCHAEEQTEG